MDGKGIIYIRTNKMNKGLVILESLFKLDDVFLLGVKIEELSNGLHRILSKLTLALKTNQRSFTLVNATV